MLTGDYDYLTTLRGKRPYRPATSARTGISAAKSDHGLKALSCPTMSTSPASITGRTESVNAEACNRSRDRAQWRLCPRLPVNDRVNVLGQARRSIEQPGFGRCRGVVAEATYHAAVDYGVATNSHDNTGQTILDSARIPEYSARQGN